MSQTAKAISLHGSEGKILILGGTSEAYALAQQLAPSGADIITSLAGRTQKPRLPAGPVRIGGFGGAHGLAAYLRQHNIRLVIDATHPFALTITANAQAATSITGIPLLRLERPAWQPQTGDQWIQAATLAEAALAIPGGCKVFLALGRQHLAAFYQRQDVRFVARMIEPPQTAPPGPAMHIILGRPGSVCDEIGFLRQNRIDCLVCRNSGGTAAWGKIIAARQLALPVIMIRRCPASHANVATSVEEAILFMKNHGFTAMN